MGLKLQMRTLDLFRRIVAGEMNTIAYIEQKPQKILMEKYKGKPYFERATPESQGVSSSYLEEFLNIIIKNEDISCHGIMILRNEKVIMEGAFAPYSNEMPQITHSMAKSIVGIAIGIAVSEGLLSLDESIGNIFGKMYLPVLGKRNRDLTIRHLLTMTSGVVFNEIGSIIEEDWLKEYLDASIMFDPGTKFAYNSMNTYVLAAIIREKTGMSLMEYLNPRLFVPLEIEDVYWETCPMGREKGGWGFYINLEDRAKIAQLLLNDGVWNGKRILSSKYIEEMTSKKIDTPEEHNKYGYGYQVWMGNRKKSFLFNGVLGQYVIAYPDIQMIIVITSANSELFVQSRLMNVIEEYFGEDVFCPKERLPEKHDEYRSLKKLCNSLQTVKFPIQKGLKKKGGRFCYKGGWNRKCLIHTKDSQDISLYDELERICNVEYVIDKTDASIFPLFVQCMQNKYSTGITSVKFFMKKEKFYISVQEGLHGYEVPIGFENAEFSSLFLKGEPYRVGVKGGLIRNEDNILVLKVVFSFVEMTNERIMKFFFYPNRLGVQFYETPDLKAVINDVIPFLKFSLPSNSVENIKNLDIIQYKMSKMLAPELEMYKKE